MFSGCNFGNGAAGVTHAIINAAATTGEKTRATFANCVFKNLPTITKTGDNVTVHVIDCMERTSGARIGETGIPAGGTEGQMLVKASGTDYDAEWENVPVTDVKINGTSIVSGGVANITAAALDEPVTVSGTTPEITCTAGTRYICGEVSTISITPSLSGICDVMFTSGSTAAVLTVPSSVLWPDWFDPTALEADTTYEINIMDGVYGAVMVWA